jgi:hypothetical protein
MAVTKINILTVLSVSTGGHVDLHSIGTMMGFHSMTLWQNDTFHCRNHMNIIIETHVNCQMGKMETNCHVNFMLEELTTLPPK